MSPLVSLSHVNVSLNGTPVLHDICWVLNKGENWAITGHNGSGKSTLLRLIRGEVWPAPVDGGTRTYYFDAEPTNSPIGIRQKIALVSAEQQTRYTRQEWLLHGWQIVFTGLFDGDLLYRYPTEAEREQVWQSMARVGVADLFDANYQKLSQGQLRKLLIARALIRRPPVVALDEICVGLDPASRRQVLDLIEEVAADGTQVLYVNHRREEMLNACLLYTS
nr:ATP-binding cassette domain-containing protein [Anaerolineae bacterium]